MQVEYNSQGIERPARTRLWVESRLATSAVSLQHQKQWDPCEIHQWQWNGM